MTKITLTPTRIIRINGFAIALGDSPMVITDSYGEACGTIDRTPGMGSRPEQWRVYAANGHCLGVSNAGPRQALRMFSIA